jgi:hypothetical protein
MWRAFFLAVGVTLFVIDQAVLVKSSQAAAAGGLNADSSAPIVVRPPEWVPWTFMSAGAVVVLYSFTIPRRVSS